VTPRVLAMNPGLGIVSDSRDERSEEDATQLMRESSGCDDIKIRANNASHDA
jgi:hypothetical protein